MLALFIAKEQTCVDRGLMNLSKQMTCHAGLDCGSERMKGRDQSTWHPFRSSYKRLLADLSEAGTRCLWFEGWYKEGDWKKWGPWSWLGSCHFARTKTILKGSIYTHPSTQQDLIRTQNNIHTRLVHHVNLLKHCLIPVLRSVNGLQERISNSYKLLPNKHCSSMFFPLYFIFFNSKFLFCDYKQSISSWKYQ